MSRQHVFNECAAHPKEAKLFLDDTGPVGIQRYEILKYPKIDRLVETQMSFFWRPEEVDISKDPKDYKELTDAERHIFESNLSRQIVLDSIAGRGPVLAFMPIVSNPSLENLVVAWDFSETIHSRSYTHLLRNIHPNPSKLFDGIGEIEEISVMADDISYYFDELIDYNTLALGLDYGIVDHEKFGYTTYQHKKKIYAALVAMNAVEALRFMISFACSFGLAESTGKMIGSATILKLIARDELLHVQITQWLLNNLEKDDKDFARIRKTLRSEMSKLYIDVVNQEKEWADYLFKHGSIIGLNANILEDYIEYLAVKRMKSLDLEVPKNFVKSNPLPWMNTWLSNKQTQNALQEQESTSYLISDIKQDFDPNNIDFEL